MIILDTHYVTISFDKAKELGKMEWKGKSTSEEYQNAFTSLLEVQKN